jgi:FlaA1/EpsC-like NDP-sugar epimerase
MREFFQNKVILVTGAAGSVGQELVRQILTFHPAEIRAVDNNETELFFLGERHRGSPNLIPYLGDVRDPGKMENLCIGVDMVFHVAAFKHVGLSEYNPFDAIQTNILGVKNVIQAAQRQGVERVIFTSSDKAVNPTNVMGTTKLMGERLITAANIVNIGARQRFSSVRFGNVIGSRGSVLPIFVEQIRRGGPVTVTDPNMTRFFMTIEQAVHLVLKAAVLACGGEVFVTKMPVIRILDLARALIDLLAPVYGHDPEDIPITFTGARSGEKLYEELLTLEEMSRVTELPQMFVVLPSLRSFYGKINYSYPGQLEDSRLLRPYISAQESAMSLEAVKHFLLSHNLLRDFMADTSPYRMPKARRLWLVAENQGKLALSGREAP